MKLFEFKPKLVSCLKNYSKETFMADLMAGIIVGIVALPLAIAFGIASGVSPEKGIITAIIAGFIISLMGGSKVQIGGPTGAFIVIIYGIIQQYGEAGLIVATLMAGVLLVLLGVFKLGAVIKFIPYPIIVGFTSGIAVTIFTTQIADIFGLSFGEEKVPGDFVGKWMIYFRHFDTVNWWNTIVSVVSIIIIAITPKFSKKIPGSLIAIVVVTAAVYLMKTFGGIDCIQTIGDRFTIKSELPDAVVPALDWEAIIAVRHGSRRCDWRPPRFQHRAYRARRGKYRSPSVRRYPRYRSYRPYHDEHQQRWQDTDSRNYSCSNPAPDSAFPDAAGTIHPHGMPCRRVSHCIL